MPGRSESVPFEDIVRLTDVIQFVPPVECMHVYAVVNRVRDICINQDSVHEIVKWETLRDELSVDFESLTAVVNSPRKVRHSLRCAYQAWEKGLAGEVNWYDLFILNALRLSASSVWYFLVQWRRKLLDGDNNGLGAIWDKIIDQHNLDEIEVPLINTIRFIFPGFLGGEDKRNTVQRICEDRYWYRALNELVPNQEVRDQQVLKDLQQFFFESNENPLHEGLKQYGEEYKKVLVMWMEKFAEYAKEKEIDQVDQKLDQLKKIIA